MKIEKPSHFGAALRRGPYVWPGGYPCYFICNDGAALSFKYARENAHLICQAIRENSNCGWRVVGVEVNWEDPGLYCEGGERIESAYAEA